MKVRTHRLLLLAGIVTLSACATAPPPVSTPAKPPVSKNKPPVGLQASPAPNPEAMPAAALALARQADAAAKRLDWVLASRQLERALQIAPRNPLLWQRLAAVRYSQGRYRQAETFAAKSNAFAVGDAPIQALNWRIIAAARQALGDRAGALKALQQARAYGR